MLRRHISLVQHKRLSSLFLVSSSITRQRRFQANISNTASSPADSVSGAVNTASQHFSETAENVATVAQKFAEESASSSLGGASVATTAEAFTVYFEEHFWWCALVGVISLASGIVLINLNERRAAKQNLLDDTIAPLVVSLNQTGKNIDGVGKSNSHHFETANELDGIVFHAHGDLVATEPYPQDATFNIQAPHCLKLQRVVEMFQWVENRERKTDSEGKSCYTYSYEPRWSSYQQRITNNDEAVAKEKQNPPFPAWNNPTDVKEMHLIVAKPPRVNSKPFEITNNTQVTLSTGNEEENMSLAARMKSTISATISSLNSASDYHQAERNSPNLKLRLSADFVRRVTDFIPLVNITTSDNMNLISTKHNLELRPSTDSEGRNQTILYTKNGDPSKPRIGDVKVAFFVVPEDKYTVLGIYKPTEKKKLLGISLNYPAGICPVRGHLRQTLASQGEMVVPDEAHSLMSRTKKYHGQESLNFTGGEWFLDGIESMMLQSAPLEFAYINKEVTERDETISNYRAMQGRITRGMLYNGIMLTSIGSALLCYCTVPFMSERAFYFGSLLGLVISWKTKSGAEKQQMKKMLREENKEAEDEAWGEESSQPFLVDTRQINKRKGTGIVEL